GRYNFWQESNLIPDRKIGTTIEAQRRWTNPIIQSLSRIPLGELISLRASFYRSPESELSAHSRAEGRSAASLRRRSPPRRRFHNLRYASVSSPPEIRELFLFLQPAKPDPAP